MENKAAAMVLASFAGDSLALAAHWNYDVIHIERTFGRIENLLKPDKDHYHAGKDRGEFTHYGDQMLVLLESVAACSGFDPDHFSKRWQELFTDYKGYIDKATRGTLQNLASGMAPPQAGSPSSDLAGAARIAPLVYRYRSEPEALIAAARLQTAMTHNNPLVIDSAEFFARVAYLVLQGANPAEAVAEAGGKLQTGEPFRAWIAGALRNTATPTVRAVTQFGQSCDARGAFPAVLHIIVRHQESLREALVENVMAGGDSAARGLLVGMVLGAHLGLEAVPEEWIKDLVQYGHIMELLTRINSKKGETS